MIAGHCVRSASSRFLLPFQGSVLQNTDHVACQYARTVLYYSLAQNCRENQNDCINLPAAQAQFTQLLKWPTYNALNYKWSEAHFNTSVYAAGERMSAALLYAVDQSVPRGSIRITKYPSLFSDSVIYCMCKKNYSRRRFRKKNAIFIAFKISQTCRNYNQIRTDLPGSILLMIV